MICERCGHERRPGHQPDTCIANLRTELARVTEGQQIERMKRQATEGIAQQMAAEYDAIRDELAQSRKRELDAETRACAAEERAYRLEAALRFYADPVTWLVVYDHHATEEAPYENSFVPANNDGGQQARAALEQK